MRGSRPSRTSASDGWSSHEDRHVAEPRQDLGRQLVERLGGEPFELISRQARLGAVVRLVEAKVASHSLTMPLASPCVAGDAEQVARVGLVEWVEGRAGEQFAQQARGLGGLLVRRGTPRPTPARARGRRGRRRSSGGTPRAPPPGRPARARETPRARSRRGRPPPPRGRCAAPASRRASRPPRAPPRRRRAGVRVRGLVRCRRSWRYCTPAAATWPSRRAVSADPSSPRCCLFWRPNAPCIVTPMVAQS